MRHSAMMLALIWACYGETTGDPRPARALYEASDAAMRSTSPGAALEMMEAVAEGKSTEVILAAAARAGIKERIDSLAFRATDYSVRAFAMEMIGRTGLPEAIHYLSQMTPEKLGRDDSRGLYPASQVALQKALLQREKEPQSQVASLEQLLSSAKIGQVALWAQEELCNRGSLSSMELIEPFIKRLDSSSRGEERVAFCRKRMAVVNSDPDRTKALASALNADAPASDERVLRWAADQLISMHTPKAEAALDGYVAEVARRFPARAPEQLTQESYFHRGLAQEIRSLLPETGQK